MDNLAHKILHTFEKMDPINPTFEPVIICNKLLVEFDLRLKTELWLFIWAFPICYTIQHLYNSVCSLFCRDFLYLQRGIFSINGY